MDDANPSTAALAAERDAYLRQRDESLGERNELRRQLDVAIGEGNELRRQLDIEVGEHSELRRQLDIALGEHNELRRQLDIALGEHNELRRQLDIALGEHNELRRQLDIAAGERNELRRQLDETLGVSNQLVDRIARHAHRADMAALRGGGVPAAATRDVILLFLHLAKTGGVTLNEVIVRNLSAGEYLVLDMPPKNDSVLWTWAPSEVDRSLARMTRDEVGRIRAVLGHYRPDIQSHLPRPCAAITLLRHPIERILSYFYYDVRRGVRLGEFNSAGVDAFVAEGADIALDNYMTRILSGREELDPVDKDATLATCRRVTQDDYLAARKAIDQCISVGLTERFDETLLVLASVLGWSLSDLVYERRNVTDRRPQADDLSRATRQKLEEMNGHDLALFAYAGSRLAQQIAEYAGDLDRDLFLLRRLNAAYHDGAGMAALRALEHETILHWAPTRGPAGRHAAI